MKNLVKIFTRTFVNFQFEKKRNAKLKPLYGKHLVLKDLKEALSKNFPICKMERRGTFLRPVHIGF